MWSFGIVPLVLIAVFVIGYLVFHQLRTLGAWMKRGSSPKDRVFAHVIMLAILGLVLGGFLQPVVDCVQSGIPLFECVRP